MSIPRQKVCPCSGGDKKLEADKIARAGRKSATMTKKEEFKQTKANTYEKNQSLFLEIKMVKM